MSFISRMIGGVFGDVTGTASAKAGRAFMDNAEDVFSGNIAQKYSGLDQSVLQQAWKATDDAGFESVVRGGGGVTDEVFEGLQRFRNEVIERGNDGGQISFEGMESMMRNQAELGNMYGGFSRAGGSASPNALLRGIGGESSTGAGNFAGLLGVAGLAGAANVAMGGDFFEGAAVGGGVAFGVRGVAKGIAGTMGELEQSMVKRILGDDMIAEGASKVSVPKGTSLDDIFMGGHGSRKVEDFGLEGVGSGKSGRTIDELVNEQGVDPTTVKSNQAYNSADQYTGAEARRTNLRSIEDMADNDERLKGFGKGKMRELLSPDKKKNVAMNNRALVLGGGMLSGVAFTGQSDKRDYRRGFNAHRGNRI